MTLFYQTNSWISQPQQNEKRLNLWNHIAKKANWRIVQLPNGYYQTEYKDPDCECNPEKDTCCEKWVDVTRRESMQAAETSIDKTIEHYQKKVEFLNGPKVVKTFK
tara:strand:- start:2885 stop:3202 length:318 start_codon:yes stop_codon:yes gene_type:complete